MLEATASLEIVQGSIGEREVVEAAMVGVTHVVHMATVKETPDLVMDITVKGLFQLLEASRVSPTFQQFMLIGGDAAMGHFFYKHPAPVTETQKWSAYPGCYALSKALEECMLEQYFVQYGLNGCCLMAPWIMEKDDFRYHMSFGDDLFGGPSWKDYVAPDAATAIAAAGAGSTVPLALDADGAPLKRNFIHVDDLVECMLAALSNPVAKQQKYNVSMDEPVDYADVASYLEASRGTPSVNCQTEFHSTWLDNSKAKFHLGWRPKHDAKALIDAAWTYRRSVDDPRTVYYPG
jgi:nucleoside-diphosphate-sugar epimerase